MPARPAESMPEAQAADINQVENPGFFERAKMCWRKIALAGALGVGALGAAAGVGAFEDQDLSVLKHVDVAEVGGDAITVTEEVAPFLIGASVLGLGALAATRPGRKNLELAWKGIAPYERKFTKSPLARGMLMSALGIGALSTALMIEDGIRTGANQNISTMSASVGADDASKQLVWMLEPGADHFMNDSQISQDIVQQIQQDITAEPFGRELVTIPTRYNEKQASMLISVQAQDEQPSPILPEVKPDALCETVDSRCNLAPNELIIDEGEGLELGETVEIRGREFTVVAFSEEDQSLINRLVAFTGTSEEVDEREAYGLVSLVDSKEAAQEVINDLGLTEQLDVQTTAEFTESNEGFWDHNGTPLILLLVGDIAIFAGASFAALKGFEQQRDRAMLGGLRAIGVSKRDIAKQEYSRVAMHTLKGIVPGYVGALAATKLINSLLAGFDADVNPKMVAASAGVIMAIQLGASARSLREMGKKTPIELMKQA